jgi:uncharacterized protein (DUF427 family)
VRVAVDGAVVAESERPLLVLETDLPLRAYLPPADVRMEALRPTATRTVCAYKGVASYWAVGDQPDLAWAYAEPLPEAQRLQGLICFLNERVDLELDGELLKRPRTHWSAGLRSNLRGGPSGAG